MKTKLALLQVVLTVSSVSFAAQVVSIGVKGGVPLTDAFQAARGNNSAYISNTKRYTVGPTIEFHLPARFSIEIDGLYTRVGFDGGVTNASGGTTSYSVTRANSWEIPILGKFEITPGPVRPFIDAGPILRNISGIRQVRSAVSGVSNGIAFDNAPEFNKRTDVGATFGGGITFKAGPVRLSPEFRYTRWGGENFRDPVNALLRTTRNDGKFLIGFTF